MLTPSLRSFFETEERQRRALDVVAMEGWLDPRTNLDLYDASQIAFDPSSDADEAFCTFNKIYDELSGPWRAFRPGNLAECWPSQKIFDTIKSEFREFARSGSVNLLNFQESSAERLKSGLTKMKGIKPKKDFPTMTVSKFLHFYNPALFPIYDTAVIWNKVFARFRTDYRDFCNEANIPCSNISGEDTPAFLCNYIRWGRSLMSSAHPAFMQTFTGWLDQQPGTLLASRKFDAAAIYATAFEYVAIGAASAS